MNSPISTNTINNSPGKPSNIRMNTADNPPPNPPPSKNPATNPSNQPQKKPSAAVIDKKERKQLWQSLAKYCDALIEEARTKHYVPTHRFVHPQSMIDNFIKLGLRPPNNPRGLEKFYDNFITRCNYLADNNKNAKNKSKNPPKKWMPKDNRSKYTKKRAHKHFLRVPHTSRLQSHNKMGSFPIVSQSVQHQYHQYHINKNTHNTNNQLQPQQPQQQPPSYTPNPSAKKQLRSQLPAPRAPKIYSNSLTLLQRKKFGPHVISVNTQAVPQQQLPMNMERIPHQNMSIQSPIHLPNEQLTPDQLMARYHAQINQQQQQQQRVIYHAQHDNYYRVNVGTPPSNQSPQTMYNPNKRKKRDAQSLPNKQMRNATKQYAYNKQQQIQMNQMVNTETNTMSNNANINLQLRDDHSHHSSNESNHSHHSHPNMVHSQMGGTQRAAGNLYVALQNHGSMNSSISQPGGNEVGAERPSLSTTCPSGNTVASHYTQHTEDHSQSYVSLRDHLSMNSSSISHSQPGGGNEAVTTDLEHPLKLDGATSGNTDVSFSHNTYDSRDSNIADKEHIQQQGNPVQNLNLRIAVDTARTADIIPPLLPHNVSSRYNTQYGCSRTPIPVPNPNTAYQSPMPTHARSQSATLYNNRKQAAILQQQYNEFNQLSPINANQAVRTFARQNVIPHNQNKSSAYAHAVAVAVPENMSPIASITPVDNNQRPPLFHQHSFGLQTVPELKEEIPTNASNYTQQYVAAYSPASPYNVNGVTVGMMGHSQDSSLSLSSNLITPKITPSANSSFFSPTALQYEMDDHSFDYTAAGQSISGYQTPASPFMMQTLYEDNSIEQRQRQQQQQQQLHAAAYYNNNNNNATAMIPNANTGYSSNSGTATGSDRNPSNERGSGLRIQEPEQHQRTATPFDYDATAAYHARNNSLNIAQNNLIRSKLLDAQWLMDSNASGVSQWSAISGKSDDVITVGFINTDGAQVRSLFEFLQNDVEEAIILDLNAVRSRSSSMASGNRHTMKQSADELQGMVFTAYHPNQASGDTLTPFEMTPNTNTPNTNTNNNDEDGTGAMNTFSGQLANFATCGVAIINEKEPCKPDTLKPETLTPSTGSNSKSSGHSKHSHSTKSSGHSRQTTPSNHSLHSGHSNSVQTTPLSPNIMNYRISGKHHSIGSIHCAPHNDLDGLVIFEPVKTFEILDLYRAQMKDDAFLSVRALFEKTLQSAFVGCVKYLRHRLKHTMTPIKYVFFVTFAMPNPNGDVSQIWYDLCKLRMEHIANTVRQCQILCDQSKMNTKFSSCMTPIDANSFSDKTPSSTEGDIYSNKDDVLANYHFPDYAQYQAYLPFKNRIELSQCIRQTLKPHRSD